MKENYYIISESELLDLLETYHYANCLDADGVDNWSWYLVGRKEYLGDFEDFKDKAKDDLQYYTKVGE